MNRQTFAISTGIIIVATALAGRSNAQHPAPMEPTAGTPAAHPGCAGCKAGYVRLTKMTSDGRKFVTSQQSQFAFPQLVGVGRGNGIMVVGAAWWTSGGVLRITATSGSLSAGWEILGAKVKVPHSAPPPSGTMIKAGWYNAILACRTARCENVYVTVNEKPIEPYAPPLR